MSRRPALVAENYVLPGQRVGLRVLDVFGWANSVVLKSVAFEGGPDYAYPAEIGTDDSGRYATVEVPIEPLTTAGPHPVTIEYTDGLKQTASLIVDSATPSDTLVVALTPLDTEGYTHIDVSPLSKNIGWSDAKTDLPMPPQPPGSTLDLDDSGWFGLTGDKLSGHQGANFVMDPNTPAGAYKVWVRQQFHGNPNPVIVEGKVIVPEKSQPAAQAFHLTHNIDLKALGDKDVVSFRIPFGKELPDLNYHADVSLKPGGTKGGDPSKLTDSEAAALERLNTPIVRYGIDHLTVYARNPHDIRTKSGFALKYRVLITPVDTGHAASDNGEGAAE